MTKHPGCPREELFNGVTYQCELDAGHEGDHGYTYHGVEWVTFPALDWEHEIDKRTARSGRGSGDPA